MIINHTEQKTKKILDEMKITKFSKINVFEISNYLDINVEMADLNNGLSRLFVIKYDKKYIRYSNTIPAHSKHFTIAHLIGPFYLHKDIPLFIEKNEKLIVRENISTLSKIMKEREANVFAFSLLIPKHFLIKEIEIALNEKQYDIVGCLADKFNVIKTMMSFRLAELDYDYGLFG